MKCTVDYSFRFYINIHTQPKSPIAACIILYVQCCQDHNALMAMKAVTQKQTGVAEGGATSPLSTVNSAALQDITFTFTQQLARSVLYGLSVFLSMILMVIFMLFDVGLAVMVCAGAAIGFGIFQNKFSQKKSTARRPYSATPSNATQTSSCCEDV
mmetsp:Transcript_47282/g.69082  ORF Transcript_47282/g.69082 Transcript_47282/m.69082 type:complete len:156 (+) Transcript_47282:1055-1522(+)